MNATAFELPSDCKGDGFDIAMGIHKDDKPLTETTILREKIYANGCFVGYSATSILPKRVNQQQAKLLQNGKLGRVRSDCATACF